MNRKSLFAVVVSSLCLVFSGLHGDAHAEAPLTVGDTAEDVGTFIELEGGDKVQFVIDTKANKIVARFVDIDNVIIENPADSILFIIDDDPPRTGDWRTIMDPAENATLIGTRLLYPPYRFRAKIIIRFTGEDPSTFTNVLIELDRNLAE